MNSGRPLHDWQPTISSFGAPFTNVGHAGYTGEANYFRRRGPAGFLPAGRQALALVGGSCGKATVRIAARPGTSRSGIHRVEELGVVLRVLQLVDQKLEPVDGAHR